MKRHFRMTLFIVAIILNTSICFADNIIRLNNEKTSDVKKRWKVQFEKELDEFSITSDNIKLFEDNKELFFQYGLENGNKTLILVSGEGNYKKDKKYRFEISENIRFVDGTKSNKKIILPFEIDDKAVNKSEKEIQPGSSLKELIDSKGNPNRIDKHGEYNWYSYFDKYYSEYIVYHVRNNKVEHILVSKRHLIPEKKITWNSTRADIEKVLGKTKYDQYIINNNKVEFIYDNNDGRIVNMIISQKNTDYWSIPFDESLINIYERQIFDMTNAFRRKKGLGPYIWSEEARLMAKKHSRDMAKNNFIGHVSSNGDTLDTRFKKHNLKYTSAGENAGGGFRMGSLGVMMGWINSSGHRANLLGDFTYIGTGGAIGIWNTYTQVFYNK